MNFSDFCEFDDVGEFDDFDDISNLNFDISNPNSDILKLIEV